MIKEGSLIPEVEVTEISGQKEIGKQQVFVGRYLVDGGHKFFEYNVKTNELSYACFESDDVDFVAAERGIKSKKGKVVVRDYCLYVPALNFKNAIKRFRKMTGNKDLNPEIKK